MFSTQIEKGAQFLPTLPQGKDPLESMWGTPEFKADTVIETSDEKSWVKKTYEFYKNYWGFVGDVFSGKAVQKMQEGKQRVIGQPVDTSPSLGWVAVLGVVAAGIYFTRGK